MLARTLAGIVASGVLGASAVQAETTVIAKAGGWSAFGGKTENGKPVCGVSRDINNQYFGLKLFFGEDTFTIQMGSAQWKVVDKARVKVVMTIDAHSNWNATGTGFHFADGDAGLEFDIDKNQVGKFMSEFRSGTKIRIQFEGTMLADWVLDLRGTDEVSAAFSGCARKLQ